MLVMMLGQTRGALHDVARRPVAELGWPDSPRFRTPWLVTIAVGVMVAFLPAFFNIYFLGELVSMGTLLAFTIVCVGVWVMRKRQPDLARPFRTPWVPFVPIMGILISLSLSGFHPTPGEDRICHLALVGLVIYFGYSTRHSKVQKQLASKQAR